jgi:magnesium-transporting ATPase (P-type)
MPCDALLLAGQAVVNEAVLTGESTPVTKIAVDRSDGDELYDPDSSKHAKFTMYCGTNVLQAKGLQYPNVCRTTSTYNPITNE